MPNQILGESLIFRRLIGYIGEQIAEHYLRKEGFAAYVLGNSGCGVRIGDVCISRKWFHSNGTCQGHCDTIGVEVKTTLSNNFCSELSERQKQAHKRYRLPVLSIRILSIQPNKIEYDMIESPVNWTQSHRFESWKGEPKYYDQHPPRPCHKFRDYAPISLEDKQRWAEQRYLKTIRFIRRALRNIGYCEINSDPLQKTLDYVV
jgi:hypothetical protein